MSTKVKRAKRIRICGVEHARRGTSRWNKTHLRWRIQGGLPGVMTDAMSQAFVEAFASWQAVCGLTFEQVGSGRADILIATGRIDGPSGTLAWSELPPSNPVQQMYDVSESWTVLPRGGLVDLVAVAAHEIGHAIGLGHDNSGGQALLDAFYNPRIRTPRPRDISRSQELYGPPKNPEPEPPAGVGKVIVIADPGIQIEVRKAS